MFSRQFMFSSIFVLAAVLLLELNAIGVTLDDQGQEILQINKGSILGSTTQCFECAEAEKVWRAIAAQCGFQIERDEQGGIVVLMLPESTCHFKLEDGTIFAPLPPPNTSTPLPSKDVKAESFFNSSAGIAVLLFVLFIALILLGVTIFVVYKIHYPSEKGKLITSAKTRLEVLQARKMKKKEQQAKKNAQKKELKGIQKKRINLPQKGSSEENAPYGDNAREYYSPSFAPRCSIPSKKSTRRSNSVKKRLVSRKYHKKDSLEKVGASLFNVLKNNMK